MRRFLLLTIAAVSTVAAATPAFAQDDTDLSGFRIEAVAGWDNFSTGHGNSTSKDDIVWGFGAGYDFQTSGVVIGVEGEVTWTGVDATAFGVLTPSDSLRLEAARDLYIGARVGVPFTPQFLGYVKGGYTNLLIESTYNPANLGGVIEDSSSDTSGYRFGAGIEYRFNPNFSVKGEYRYSHYSAIGEHNPDFNIDTDRNQILIGVGYHF